MKPITELFPGLATPKKVVIIMHQNPDPDAMGASLALYEFLVQLNHTATVVSPTHWSENLNWMINNDKVLNFETYDHKEEISQAIQEADWLFCLDFNTISRTKNLASAIYAATCTRILIDHHQQPEVESFHYGISNTAKSSTCEMLYDFIVASGHEDKMNLPINECIYAGLVGDTGSFRYPNTTQLVHNMVAKMKEKGLQHARIHENICANIPENQFRFLGHALSNRMQVFKEFNTAAIVIHKSDLSKFEIKNGETGSLIYHLMSLKGIKLGAICIESDEGIRWSFRSKGSFDVNTFAKTYFNGGGHLNASGGKASGSLAETVLKFNKAVEENASQLQQCSILDHPIAIAS